MWCVNLEIACGVDINACFSHIRDKRAFLYYKYTEGAPFTNMDWLEFQACFLVL